MAKTKKKQPVKEITFKEYLSKITFERTGISNVTVALPLSDIHLKEKNWNKITNFVMKHIKTLKKELKKQEKLK